jgi:hypothetical protein
VHYNEVMVEVYGKIQVHQDHLHHLENTKMKYLTNFIIYFYLPKSSSSGIGTLIKSSLSVISSARA